MTTRDQRRETRWLGLAIIIICMAGGEIVRAACTTEYEYNDAGDATRTFIHDGQGATVSDTFTVYDALGRQSTVFNRTTVGSNGGAMTTVYTYDVAGRLATKAVKTDGPADFATSYVYDALGRQVTVQGPATNAANAPMTIYDYDPNGNVITQSVRLYGSVDASTITDYDALNRATKVTDPEGHYRTTVYDSQGRAITTYAYSSGGATILEQTRTEYDGAGRVITRVRMSNAGNTGAFSVTTDNVVAYAYDADGHVTSQTTYNMGTATALDTTSEYDGLGRLTKTTDPNGFWEQTAYDATGLATMRVSYDYAGQTFSMGYDPDGRMTQQIALGSTNLTTGYQYDCLDRRTRAIDPKGYATVYEYDLLAHQTKVTEDDDGALPRATWSMYNQQGWLTDLIAYDGVNYQTTHYGYNDAGLKATIWYPDCTNYSDANDAIVFLYDRAGRVTGRQDQLLTGVGKRALAYTYDLRGLLLTKSDGAAYQESFVYDGLGRMVTALKGASGAECATAYAYDDLSRMTRESQGLLGGAAKDTISTYDQAGNRITLMYPTSSNDAITLVYQYDGGNRATEVRRKLGASAEQDLIAYDYHGRDMSRRRLRTEYTELSWSIPDKSTVYVDYVPEYDDHRRITRISDLVNDSVGTGAKNLAIYDYQYDEAGNRLGHTGHRPSNNGENNGFGEARAVAYAYDTLHRVTRSDYTLPPSVSTVFEYDRLGNRNTVYDTLNGVTYSYAHNNANEYTAVSLGLTPQDAYLYDVYGNLSRDDGFNTGSDYFEYGYDPENRLTRVEYNPGTGLTLVAAYRYDAQGRRVEFINSPPVGVTTTLRYYYDGPNMIAEYDVAANTLTRTYVHGTQYVDERAVMRDHHGSGQDYYYLLEELYSAAGLVKSNGTLAEAYVYDTYGQATLYRWGVGDFDRDIDCDLSDFSRFQACYNGPNRAPKAPLNTPGCQDADIDMDGDIDLSDNSAFQGSFNGPNRPAKTFAQLTRSNVGNPHLFTGRITDTVGMDGTNYRRLQDNRNRMYDPKHGRWLQRDPLGVRSSAPRATTTPDDQYEDGMSLYQYVRSVPTVFVDWSGAQASQPRPRPLPPPGSPTTQPPGSQPSSQPTSAPCTPRDNVPVAEVPRTIGEWLKDDPKNNAKLISDIGGNAQAAANQTVVSGCKTSPSGLVWCGFVTSVRFKSNCCKNIIQVVRIENKSWTHVGNQANALATTELYQIEGWSMNVKTGVSNEADDRISVVSFAPGDARDTVCTTQTFTQCCGTYGGGLIRAGYQSFYQGNAPDPYLKKVNCCGPKNVSVIKFCANRWGWSQFN